MVTEHLLKTVISCVAYTMHENRFLLFLNHLRLTYSNLKSFALILNIHCARHTFATTVTLANDISLEVVSQMMGHSNTRMTTHYAKVIDKSIGRQMNSIVDKYEPVINKAV